MFSTLNAALIVTTHYIAIMQLKLSKIPNMSVQYKRNQLERQSDLNFELQLHQRSLMDLL